MAEEYFMSFRTVGTEKNGETDLETGYSLQKAIMIIFIPICSAGLFGNTIVFCLLCCSIRKTNLTVYFLNMVVADFVILIYYVALFIIFLKVVPISIYYWHIMEMVHTFGFNAKTYILTAIAVERYVMVFFPVSYQRRPQHFSETACAILWGASGLIALMLYFACYLQIDPTLNEFHQNCELTRMVRVIINLLVFLPIMVFSTFLLFLRMLRTSQEAPLAKIDITIVALVLLFLLFAASVRILEIISRWAPEVHIPIVYLIFHFLDAIDSSGKAFIYIAVGYSKKDVDENQQSFQTLVEGALLDDGTSEEDYEENYI